jgi:predicted dienelactone hydrolase
MNTKTKWITITLCIAALVIAAIIIRLNVQAVASPPADQTGPYMVGFVVNTYYDSTRSDFAGGPRPIQTFIWYPAATDNNGNPLPPADYPMNVPGLTGLPDASSTDFEAYGIDPAYQEAAASKDGPFPLVVFSPGAGADSLGYVHIGTRLASHGFVVAVPTNYDDKYEIKADTTTEPVYYPTQEAYAIGTYANRIRDVQYLMTRLVADSAQSGNLLYGIIRPDQIAISGHSVGGAAALALAGGDDQICDMMGLDPNKFPPETCGSIVPDPRVRAIVAIDGSSQFFHFAEFSRIKIPSMVIGQEWNVLESQQAGIESLLARPHAAIQSHPNYRVDVAYAIHNSFSSYCSYLHILNDKGFIDDQMLDTAIPYNCPPESISAAEIENLTTQYMIAFLKTVLVGENGYQEMLTTDYALENEPFIEFFETEQGDPAETVEEDYFSYFKHQPGTERTTALKDPFLKVP